MLKWLIQHHHRHHQFSYPRKLLSWIQNDDANVNFAIFNSGKSSSASAAIKKTFVNLIRTFSNVFVFNTSWLIGLTPPTFVSLWPYENYLHSCWKHFTEETVWAQRALAWKIKGEALNIRSKHERTVFCSLTLQGRFAFRAHFRSWHSSGGCGNWRPSSVVESVLRELLPFIIFIHLLPPPSAVWAYCSP